MLAPSPQSKSPNPRVGYDQPLANAMFRYQKRLSEDGTLPDNAWVKARKHATR